MMQGSREKVREYAAKASSLATARTAMSSMQGDMKLLEAERKALSEERGMQGKITDKYWREQQELDAQVQDILKERQRIKELQVLLNSPGQWSKSASLLESLAVC